MPVLLPQGKQYYETSAGVPLVGGKVYTCDAGTSNPRTTWSDAAGTQPNTNPVILDSRGEAVIFWNGNYKVVIKDSLDVTIWTVDNVSSIPQDNSAADTGAVNAIVLSLPNLSTPSTFNRIIFKAANTNTGATTIAINGGAAKALTWQNTAALSGGEIQAGGVYEAVYDGTQWQLIAPSLFPFQIRSAAEIAKSVVPSNYSYRPGNIRRYGAVCDGTTDDAAAVRKALDVAAQDGTTVTCEPPGVIKINSTVYLPQRFAVAAQYGYEIDLYGSTIVGQGNGTGTVFETGTGAYSTGGATNFGQPNESATSIHYGTVIKGVKFRNYGFAFRLFNFLQGGALRDVWGEQGHTLVYAKRCFYMTLYNCVGKALSGMTATEAVLWFDTENNVIKLLSCSAAATGGTALRFDGGVKGLLIDTCAFEQSATGVKFNDAVLGAEIRGCYIEGNTTAIDLGGVTKYGLNIDGNYFFANATDITGNNWISGTFGKANVFEDAPLVDLSGTGNYCRLELPPHEWPNSGAGDHTNYTTLPTGYSANAAVEIVHQDSIFNGGVGLSGQFAKLASNFGASGMVGLNYVGIGGQQATGVIPFCTTTIVAANSLQIDTKISFTQAASTEFDVQVIDGVSTYLVSGRVSYGTVLPRFDATAKTVTLANNAGNLRITLGGFAGITSYNGSVRIV